MRAKLSLFNLAIVSLPVMMFTLAASRAADTSQGFSWTQAQGPPQQLTAACSALSDCAPAGCTNLSQSVILQIGNQSYVVWSYGSPTKLAYGNCSGYAGTCYAYPDVWCATVAVYGMPDCNAKKSWGNVNVYAGQCAP